MKLKDQTSPAATISDHTVSRGHGAGLIRKNFKALDRNWRRFCQATIAAPA
jgi:hypothetical protein